MTESLQHGRRLGRHWRRVVERADDHAALSVEHPGLPGHNWANAIAMATPIAHKGAIAGAKVQALTMLDICSQPTVVDDAWDYFRNVQTKTGEVPAAHRAGGQAGDGLNAEIMAKYRPEMRKFYYDPTKYPTYLAAARDRVSDAAQGGRELRRDAESIAVSD